MPRHAWIFDRYDRITALKQRQESQMRYLNYLRCDTKTWHGKMVLDRRIAVHYARFHRLSRLAAKVKREATRRLATA